MRDAEVRGNGSIEDRAVRLVIERERKLGRDARDVRNRREIADVESSGRFIEVKCFSGSFKPRLGSLLFTPAQLKHARDNDAYFVYLVENLGQPEPTRVTIRVIHGDVLRRMVTDPGVQIQRYIVPLRIAEYDKLPHLEDPVGRLDER